MGLADELEVADLRPTSYQRSIMDQLLDALDPRDADAVRVTIANNQFPGSKIAKFLQNYGKKLASEKKGKPSKKDEVIIDLCSRIKDTTVQRYRRRSVS